MKRFLSFFALLVLMAPRLPAEVHEKFRTIEVRSTAVVPPEVTDGTQAKAICREAAITRGQGELLNYVLGQRAASKRPLGESENASVTLHDEIRAIVKASQVKQTHWGTDDCAVTLVMDKARLRRLQKRN